LSLASGQERDLQLWWRPMSQHLRSLSQVQRVMYALM
jgi:hypothetical protein